VSTEGSCAQYGMIAVQSIDVGETLFEIPRKLLLSVDHSAIGDVLRQGGIEFAFKYVVNLIYFPLLRKHTS